MKKILITGCFLVLCFLSIFSQTNIVIAGKTYEVDTLQHFPVGPGTTYTALNFKNITTPASPLRVFFLEIDLKNPNLKIEAVTSKDVLRGTERPSTMAERKTKGGATYYAGINGDFYNTATASYDYGTPINGFMSGCEIGAMPASGRAGIGFTVDNLPITGNFAINGSVAKGGESVNISTVNYSRPQNSLAFYNSYNGATTNTDDNGTEVLISVPNDEWSVSNGIIEATVVEKHENKGNIAIGAKKAVLSATGTAQAFLNNLNVGDKVQLDLSAYIPSEGNQSYKLSEWIGGDQVILRDGAWTNFEWDGAPVHPRTAMGYSADKTKAYACVVDGRYSLSAGVNMQQLAAIMIYQGASYAVNLDGGGSSCMYVKEFSQVNHPSDGGERAVSNALFAVATSPDDNNVTRLEFQDFKIETPIYSKLTPVIMGYNQYGVLINKDISSLVTLSCDPQIGRIDENGAFVAGTVNATGLLTATYNGVTTSRKVVVKSVTDIKMKLSKVLIDDRFDYEIEVNGVIDGVEKSIESHALSWLVDNESVCKVENGVLKGLSNGTATITGTLGSFSKSIAVTVEISDNLYYIQENFKDMSSFKKITTSSNITDFKTEQSAIGQDLRVSYTYTGSSYSTIEFEKTIQTYSLPDTIIVSINTGNVPFTKIGISLLQNNEFTKKFVYLESLEVGKDAQLKVVVSDFLTNPTDISSYPIKINKIMFYPDDTKHTAGSEYKFFIKDISLAYVGKASVGINDEIIAKDSQWTVYPNPVKRGEDIYVKLKDGIEGDANVDVSIYSITGELMSHKKLTISDNEAVVPTDKLASGNYLLQLRLGNSVQTMKIIVK